MQTEQRLLFGALDRHKAHTGTSDRFTDGLGIIAIILAPFAVGYDKTRGHYPDPVAYSLKLPTLMMGPTTGFHADETWRLLG